MLSVANFRDVVHFMSVHKEELMLRRFIYLLSLLPFVFVVMASMPQASAGDEVQAIHSDFDFNNNPGELTRVLDAQKNAVADDKLLLVVLGATWCSDSQALARQLSSPKLRTALTERFEVVAADTGYFTAGFDIADHFNLPTYYGTPTVLMVEPSSGAVLNRVDFHEWMNAKEKSEEQYWNYFIRQNFSQTPEAELAPELKQEIANYEQQQAQRIRNAYLTAGKLLKEYKESGEAPSERFVEVWFELADYRNTVAQAVSEAIKTKNTDSLPQFPHKFVWELEE